MFAMDEQRPDERQASEKRELVRALLTQGLSYGQISQRLGMTKSTVAYHARRLGIPADDKASRRYDWAAIQLAYDAGLTVRECAARFGFCLASWTAAVQRGAIRPRPVEMPLEQLLVVGRSQTQRGHLKGRLVRAGLKENRCERCGLTEWRGRPLEMQLHHVNGDGSDNRLANLEFLCPNCHAQTENWGGRNCRRRAGGQRAQRAPGGDQSRTGGGESLRSGG